MVVPFYKYQGTGNDFIIIDERVNAYHLTRNQIQKMCDRHFGVGADGLMLLSLHDGYDFAMTYYNSDGNESSMCGNGGRSICALAKDLGLVQHEARFIAVDGPHYAQISKDVIALEMIPVHDIRVAETYTELNTGSPHYVHFTEDVKHLDIKKEGALIRYSPQYKDQGINVNFAEYVAPQTLFVRTYERGVEDETLSCGTGVTAAAIASVQMQAGKHSIQVQTLGGILQVNFTMNEAGVCSNVVLQGPASFVFEGNIHV